jgi:hypothetical protein
VISLGGDCVIAHCGSPRPVLVSKHPVRCGAIGKEWLIVKREYHARDAKILKAFGRCLDIQGGSLGQIDDHVVDNGANQSGAVGLVKLQDCLSASTSEKYLSVHLNEQHQESNDVQWEKSKHGRIEWISTIVNG